MIKWQKRFQLNVDEIFHIFHQHFTCVFFIQNFGAKKLQSRKKLLKDLWMKNEPITCWWNWHLLSISSTLNVQILCTNLFLYICQSQNVTRKAAEMTFVRKICAKRWWNWHLVVKSNDLVDTYITKNRLYFVHLIILGSFTNDVTQFCDFMTTSSLQLPFDP